MKVKDHVWKNASNFWGESTHYFEKIMLLFSCFKILIYDLSMISSKFYTEESRNFLCSTLLPRVVSNSNFVKIKKTTLR